MAAIVERNAAGSVRQTALVTRHGPVLAKLSCGFETEGPNGAMISGGRGRIALAGPFFCPPALAVKRHSAEPALDRRDGRMSDPDADGSQSADQPHQAGTFPTPVAGSGLQYQADHFAECLRAGLTQSPVHPLSASLAASEIMGKAVRPVS